MTSKSFFFNPLETMSKLWTPAQAPWRTKADMYYLTRNPAGVSKNKIKINSNCSGAKLTQPVEQSRTRSREPSRNRIWFPRRAPLRERVTAVRVTGLFLFPSLPRVLLLLPSDTSVLSLAFFYDTHLLLVLDFPRLSFLHFPLAQRFRLIKISLHAERT